MFKKSKLIYLFTSLSLILLLTVFVFGDTIRLKDGSIIKGKIISFDGGKFVVLIDDGQRERRLDFRAEDVESIVFDSAPNIPASSTGSRPQIKTDGDSTIITVGQNRPTTNDTAQDTPPVVQPRTVVKAAPITIRTRVLADNTSNGWTNSGWVVRKGQKIKITGSDRVSLGNGRYASPDGIATLPDTAKLMQNQPTGALIAVIGADNNEFFYVGKSLEFIAQRDGDLFLGVNEGNLNDNSGSFEVVIEIDPTTGN